MTLLPEREDVELLRFRWHRLIEIWVAYNVFLNREVLLGRDKVCINDAVVTQTTHTLLVVYYSYLYSLFDPTGTNFTTVVKEIDSSLPEAVREIAFKIGGLWNEIRDPITRIRHNMGFHGARANKGRKDGAAQFYRLHPLLPQALAAYLRVFFRELEMVFDGSRSLIPATGDEIDGLLEYAGEVEAEARRPIEAVPDARLAQLGLTREAYEAWAEAVRQAQGLPN